MSDCFARRAKVLGSSALKGRAMLDTPTPRVPDALFSEVFITDEMLARPTVAADFHREKLAIQDLAARMLGALSEVLPRFVELAMEMLEGCSAGLSLSEEASAPGRFRWHQPLREPCKV